MCQYCENLNLKDPKKAKENLRILARAIEHSNDAEQKVHLWFLSEKLVDSLVPVEEVDEQLERDWWNHTHREDE